MDDRTPSTPTPDPTPPVAVPDPHTDEALPTALEGMRPEAAANAAVRPEQDEEMGPLGGLVGASAAQVSAEATSDGDTPNPEAALLANMGVEEEGIESGQLLGLVASVVFAILALALVLVFLFYLPFRQQVNDTAADVSQYPELEQVHTDGLLKTGQYALVDSVYRVPVDNAMGIVAARYRQAEAPAGLPATRQQWNTLMVNRGMGTTVQAPLGTQGQASVENQRLALESDGQAGSRAGVTLPVTPLERGETNEEVGVDGTPNPPAPVTLGDAQ